MVNINVKRIKYGLTKINTNNYKILRSAPNCQDSRILKSLCIYLLKLTLNDDHIYIYPVRKLSCAQRWLRPFWIVFKKLCRVRSCECVWVRWTTHGNVCKRLLLLKEVGSVRLRKSDIHPVSPKTPAPEYQPIDRKKRKGKNSRRL